MTDRLRQMRALLNLRGIDRKTAAGALYLSHSALNRKLRGDSPFTPWEQARLTALLSSDADQTPPGMTARISDHDHQTRKEVIPI